MRSEDHARRRSRPAAASSPSSPSQPDHAALGEELQIRVVSVGRGRDGNSVLREKLRDVAEADAGERVLLPGFPGGGPDVRALDIAGGRLHMRRGRMQDRMDPRRQAVAPDAEADECHDDARRRDEDRRTRLDAARKEHQSHGQTDEGADDAEPRERKDQPQHGDGGHRDDHDRRASRRAEAASAMLTGTHRARICPRPIGSGVAPDGRSSEP